MSDEGTFRAAVIMVIILNLTVTLYYRIQAAKSGERISHKQEGYVRTVILRLAGLMLWACVVGYLVFPDSMRWATMPLPTWLRWTGAVLGALSALLMYWTLSSLGKNLTDTVVTRSTAALVTKGPYRLVRHPFYVTIALLLASLTILSANGLLGASGLLVLALIAWRTPTEEHYLIERFGQAYLDYKSRTGRYLPKMVGRSQ